MGHPTGAWLGFIASAQSIGQLLGFGFPLTKYLRSLRVGNLLTEDRFPPSAWVMNRYGRKTSIYIGVWLISTGAILQCASVNKTMFWVARIVVGCGTAWVGAAPTLISEIAYPTQRGPATSLYK